MPYLIEVLENDALTMHENTIKVIIMTISDLILYYPQIACTHLDRLLNLTKNYINHYASQLTNNKQDTLAWEMISNLLDQTICII